MRIGISTSVVQRGKTGIAQYIFALVERLRAYRDEHEFVLFVLEEDMPLFDWVRDEMTLVSVSEWFRHPVSNILWHQTGLRRRIREYRLDVIHIPSCRRLVWRCPCPQVGTIHDIADLKLQGKYDRLRRAYKRFICGRLICQLDRRIVPSAQTAKDLRELLGIDNEDTKIVPNGIDHERLQAGEVGDVRVIERIGIDSPFFLYLARLEHPGKNHVRLIEAFNRFKTRTGFSCSLVLAGSEWHGAEVIRATAQSSPYAEAIKMPGFVAEAEIPTLYQAALAFVFPSLYEGFGMPPLEAMACGCPVISSTCGALGEVVGDAALTVDAEDVSKLAEQMERIASDERLRRRLRERGLRWASEFDWADTTLKTVRIYKEAADKDSDAGIARKAFEAPEVKTQMRQQGDVSFQEGKVGSVKGS